MLTSKKLKINMMIKKNNHQTQYTKVLVVNGVGLWA